MKINEINYDYYNKPQDTSNSDDDFEIVQKKYNKNQRKFLTRIIIILTTLVLIFSVVFNNLSFHNIYVKEISEGSIRESITVNGKIKSANEKFYYSFAPAMVTALNVEVGDTVNAGDVLATFNSSEIDSYVLQLHYQLTQANAQYESVVAKYNVLKSTTTALESQISTLYKKWNISTTSYNNFSKPFSTLNVVEDTTDNINEDLSDLEIDDEQMLKFEEISNEAQTEIENSISKNTQDLENAITSAITKAENELEDAFADSTETLRQKIHLALLQNQLTTLQTQLPSTNELSELSQAQDLAQELYDDAKEESSSLKNGWTAEFSGVITQISIKEGSTVSPENAGMVLSDINQKMIEVDLSEPNSKKVKVGQSALVYIDNKIINAQVDFISPTATEKDGKSYIKCNIILGENSDELVVGFDVKTQIITNSIDQTVLIPNESVMTDENGKYCFIYNKYKNTISKRYFIEGISNDDYFQALIGVESKEMVVINPSLDLKDGEKAKVLEEETPTYPVIEKPLYNNNQQNQNFQYSTQPNLDNQNPDIQTTQPEEIQTQPEFSNASGTTNVNI